MRPEKEVKRGFAKDRFVQVLLAIFMVCWVLSGISPVSRLDWILENILVVLAFAVLVLTYRFYRFSNFSYLFIAVFMLMHIYGSHYTYIDTPADELLRKFTGSERNDFDRLVHLCFGLLLYYPIAEFYRFRPGCSRVWSAFFSILTITAAGAAYEILEMYVGRIVSPELGTLFLGTQGDQWDTQKDMVLGVIGGVLSFMITEGVLLMRAMLRRHASINQESPGT